MRHTWRGDNAAETFIGKALRLLNLQKDISDYDELIDNYDSSDRRRSLFDLIYPEKIVIARTYLFWGRSTQTLV
jgi:hypothetical protein